jgi:phospholipase C
MSRFIKWGSIDYHAGNDLQIHSSTSQHRSPRLGLHPENVATLLAATGQIVTDDDSFSGRVDVDNIVRELLASGKSWKSYAESRNDPLLYAKRHDPLSYFSDVVDSSIQIQNLTLLSPFSSDITNNVLPNCSFVVPNLLNDGRDGSMQLADAWLRNNIAAAPRM